jgi:hypothetical protein
MTANRGNVRILEREFVKALTRHDGNKVLSRLVGACQAEADRLRPRFFDERSRERLSKVTAIQVALIGASQEVRKR